MNVEQLRSAIENKKDVEASDVTELLESQDGATRLTARRALGLTRIRQALEASAELAREQDYADQTTLQVIERLASISDVDEPFIETVKQLGLKAASAGAIDPAMRYMQLAVNRAIAAGQSRDERSRASLRYLHDREINQAIQELSRRFNVSAPVADPTSRRISILVSAMQDEDAPSIVNLEIAQLLRANGFEVELVSTEMVDSTPFKMTARTIERGFTFVPVRGDTYEHRIGVVLKHFREHPASAIYYSASGTDNLAKLLGCIRIAPVQVWENKGLEPMVGDYDRVFQSVHPEQEVKTYFPGRSVFLGRGVVMAEQIDAAQPLKRSELGVPADAVLLATFGRMEKCATPEYMNAISEIMRNEPQAWLILAGRDAFGAVRTLNSRFTSDGFASRVIYLGPRQDDGPRLLKSVDIYCDTAPWGGGQSLMDAMQAGLPIVSFRPPAQAPLDPLGGGAMSAYAESLLTGLTDIAGAGDFRGYAAIAKRLIHDEELRRETGMRMREKAVNECSFALRMARASVLIRELIESSAQLQ